MEDINYFSKIFLSISPVAIFIVCTVTGMKMEKERPVKRTPFYGEGFKVIGYTETKVGPPWLIINTFFGFLLASPLMFFRFILQ
jgi:hypothetical protein